MGFKKENDQLIDQTVSFWQTRVDRKLNRQDAKDIIVNLSNYLMVLREWQTGRKPDSTNFHIGTQKMNLNGRD